MATDTRERLQKHEKDYRNMKKATETKKGRNFHKLLPQ